MEEQSHPSGLVENIENLENIITERTFTNNGGGIVRAGEERESSGSAED